MILNKTRIQHWRYEDGWRDIPYILWKDKTSDMPEREYDEDTVGWYCHVYYSEHDGFEEWMKDNMKGKYDATWRFNSGSPMYTVWINLDEDATIFRLRWM